jgi:hypothetical protein
MATGTPSLAIANPPFSPPSGQALVRIHIADCDGWLSEMPRKRRGVK